MMMRIVSSDLVEKYTLALDDHGFVFNQSPAFGLGMQHRHAFREIDGIVRTATNPALPILSIQVGKAIYSIRYRAQNEQHRTVVDTLVRRAKEAQ